MKTHNSIFLVIILLLLTACNNNIDFIRIYSGINRHNKDSFFEELILVRNMPESRIEQSKMMITYYDSVGLTIKNLSKISGTKEYAMRFYKSTLGSRRYFVKGKGDFYNGNKTFMGSIWIWCCGRDCTEHRVVIIRNLETATDYEHNGPDLVSTTLFSECSYIDNNDEKNDELVRYYQELRNKKKAKNNIQ